MGCNVVAVVVLAAAAAAAAGKFMLVGGFGWGGWEGWRRCDENSPNVRAYLMLGLFAVQHTKAKALLGELHRVHTRHGLGLLDGPLHCAGAAGRSGSLGLESRSRAVALAVPLPLRPLASRSEREAVRQRTSGPAFGPASPLLWDCGNNRGCPLGQHKKSSSELPA